jgi:hypothetical protein
MAITSAPRRGGQASNRSLLVVTAVLVLALAATVLALLVRGTGPPGSAVRGSGVAAAQPRVVARFSRVDLAGSNKVTVVVGPPHQSVVVRADSNLIGRITTRVVAGTLVIGTTGSFTTSSPMSVEVSVPSLATLILSGSGEITVTGIKQPVLTVNLSGSGVLYASGTATRLDVTLGGSGEAELSQLAAQDARAVVTGSGLIHVTVTGNLDAEISGSGAIMYSGNPQKLTSSITGTGAVTPG